MPVSITGSVIKGNDAVLLQRVGTLRCVGQLREIVFQTSHAQNRKFKFQMMKHSIKNILPSLNIAMQMLDFDYIFRNV
jgi:hypothetical protein